MYSEENDRDGLQTTDGQRQCWACDELQIENYSTINGERHCKLRMLVGGELQVENYSGWLQMKNGGGFPPRTTVYSELMDNYSIRL